MAYYGHDVALPGSQVAAIAYFMYPQGETAKERIDSFDPDGFKYMMTAREI